jgi:tRNA(Ile)-lysidine synthase
MNPSIEQTLASELEILRQVNRIVTAEVEKKKKAIAQFKKDSCKIDIEKLKRSGSPELFLYEIIKEYGFNSVRLQLSAVGLDH